jgi:hypothetical protein
METGLLLYGHLKLLNVDTCIVCDDALLNIL